MTAATIDRPNILRVHIRWIMNRHWPKVLAIEADSFEYPWSAKDFIRCDSQSNCTSMLAEHEDRVVGYMVYELDKRRIRILNLAVAANCRRRRVGTQMVSKLIGKLSARRRTQLIAEVRETNVAAQLFFRDAGFRAVSVLRKHYRDSPEDGYVMRYRFQPGKAD